MPDSKGRVKTSPALGRAGGTPVAGELRVSDVMTREVVTVSPRDTIVEAARRMAENRVGSVVVVEDERVVGILTEGDIVVRVVARGLDPYKTLVRDAMTPNPVTVSENTPLHLAADLMRRRGIGHLPVVDSRGRLVGIVTRSDIIRIAPGLIELLYLRGEEGEETT